MTTQTALKNVHLKVDRVTLEGVIFQVWNVAETECEPKLCSVNELVKRSDIRVFDISKRGAVIARIDDSSMMRSYMLALSYMTDEITILTNERFEASGERHGEIVARIGELETRIRVLQMAARLMFEAVNGTSFSNAISMMGKW